MDGSAGGGSLLGVAGGAQPVGLGAGFEDVGVEGDPVHDRGNEAGVGEDGAPFAERQVGPDGDGGSFFSLGDDLEQQLGQEAAVGEPVAGGRVGGRGGLGADGGQVQGAACTMSSRGRCSGKGRRAGFCASMAAATTGEAAAIRSA